MASRVRSSRRTNAPEGQTPEAPHASASVRGWSDSVMEAAWLAAVAVTPIFLNKYAVNAFEPEKIHLLRSFALVILGAWFVKGVLSPPRTVERSPHRIHSDTRPVVWTALAVMAGTVLSTVLSVAPGHSAWGTFGRSMGLYTLAACWVFFAAIATRMRSREQLDRLLSAIVLGSVPVSLYGIAQRFDMEPLLITSRAVEASRVGSTFGSPSFLGAYLILVLPLAAERVITILRHLREEHGTRYPWLIQLLATSAITGLALAALLFTGSRGAILGLLSGLFVMSAMLAAREGRRQFVRVALCGAVVAGLVLAGGAIIASRPASVAAYPALHRFTGAFDTTSEAGLQRMLLWRMAAGAMTHDQPLRSLLGHGPETVGFVTRRLVPSALIAEYGDYVVPDRTHSQSWDLLLTGGMVALLTWELLLGWAAWLSLRWLNLAPRSAWWFWCSIAGLGVAGAGAAMLWQGAAVVWLGFRLGTLAGLVLIVAHAALFQPPQPQSEQPPVLVAALCAALVAHSVEVSFSFPIGMSEALTWVYLGVLVALGAPWPAVKAAAVPGPGALYVGATLSTMTVATLGFALLTKSTSGSAFALVAAAVAGTGSAVTAAAWPGMGIALVVLLLALGWIPDRRAFRAGLSSASVITTLSFACWMALAIYLASMPALTPDAAAPNPAVLTGYERLLTLHYGVLGLLLTGLAAAIFRSSSSTAAPRVTGNSRSVMVMVMVTLALATGCAGVAAGIYTLNLRSSFADIAAAKADQFKPTRQWPVVTALYEWAARRAPFSAHYAEALGNTMLQDALATSEPQRRARLLERAEQVLVAAERRFPLEAGFADNLGDVYLQRALTETAPAGRRRDVAQAEAAFERLLALEPARYRTWAKAAYVDVAFQGDSESASEKVRRALELQPAGYEANTVSGDVDVVSARSAGGTERARLYRRARDAYVRALGTAPRQQRAALNQSAARLNWQLGDTEMAMVHLQRALEDADDTMRGQLERFRGQILSGHAVPP